MNTVVRLPPATATAARTLAVAVSSERATVTSGRTRERSERAVMTRRPAAAARQEGHITVYSDPGGSEPIGITKGSDGAVWYVNATNPVIGRITAAGVITHYSAAGLRSPSGIASGSDGALWFVNSSSAADPTAGSIGRITTSGTVTNYTYPHSFQPYGIAAGPADTIWFTNGAAAGIRWSVEKMTTSGVVTDYANPDLGALGGAHRGGGGGITQGPDGAMWFTDGNAPAAIIGRMTATGTLTGYGTPGFDVPADEIASGPPNALWFTMGEDGIGRLPTLVFSSGPTLTRPTRVGQADTCSFASLNATKATISWLVNATPQKGATARAFTPAPADLPTPPPPATRPRSGTRERSCTA